MRKIVKRSVYTSGKFSQIYICFFRFQIIKSEFYAFLQIIKKTPLEKSSNGVLLQFYYGLFH